MVYYRFQQEHESLRVGKIICLARTYKKHASEMKSSVPDEPLMFLKPDTSVIFTNDTILFPEKSKALHHEIELGVVIQKKGKDIPKDQAMDYVLGYVVGLDITARDIQTIAKKNGWPWTIAKGFDTFAPLSDVVLKNKVADPQKLDLLLKINNEVKQQGNTRDMVFSLAEIISYISTIMTLDRGDLILTGTPEGVGEIHEGDVLEASLGDVCQLRVDVKKETKDH